MGGVCGSGETQDSKFQKGGENDLSDGPVQSRGCTDILCVPLFIAAQVGFLFVTFYSFADGNQAKLYEPRDYQGAYCGVEKNWNDGPNLAKTPKLTYTMNVTSFLDIVVKQTLCSSQAAEAMMSILPSQSLKDEYSCDCCRTPCARCSGAYDTGGDLTSAAGFTTTITARMDEMRDPSKASRLFSPGSANGDTFSTDKFWSEATKYFNQVCSSECQLNASDTTEAWRTYVYKPAPDNELSKWWNYMLNASDSSLTTPVKSVMTSAFTLSAMPLSACPYHPSLCVPLPGISMSELMPGSDYCSFAMASRVVGALGSSAAEAFESMGFDSFRAASTQSFGDWAGDFQASIDTFVVVCVLSFCIGLVFLVLLRFFVGCCIWASIVLSLLFFVLAGFLSFVVSNQCEGAGVLETGKQTAVAIVVAGSTKLQAAENASEALSGEGADYRGRQRYTKNGRKCLAWDDQAVMPEYNSTNYAALEQGSHFCRNPYAAEDPNRAKTIWCITNDPDVPWEECTPIGVIQPDCSQGYAISSKNSRDALWYLSFVIWALGGVWLIIVLCFVSRIRLAIALNKVAAVFVGSNPSILLVPVVQAILTISWCIGWFYAISFLMTQVPDNYLPKEAFATYAEAYGTDTEPGKCTDKWPTGFVWRDNTCVETDGEVKCWRCSPPRFVINERFWISLFVFLWNNAFNVALGQLVISMAVALWFFTLEKGSTFVTPKALYMSVRYHLGTVAFGSFIIAAVEFIRCIMMYFEKQAEAQKNKVMVVLLKVMQCCIWCFEKCLKFLNKNAYIQTALMGTNFCVSARKAFFLILRNAARFATISMLGNAVRLIGFLCIVSSTGVIGWLLIREMHPEVEPFLPVMLFLGTAYVIAQLYMSVFGLAVDTCLQCFLAVEEMGIGSEFVPKVLKDFVSSTDSKGSS